MTEASFPSFRPRRRRNSPGLLALTRETRLSIDQFVYPLFILPRENFRKEIGSMPGQYQLGFADAERLVGEALKLGVKSFLLFGIPDQKDREGSPAWDPEGVIAKSLRRLRASFGTDIVLITDECFCEYTSHGHCGIIRQEGDRVFLDNDKTLPNLARQCVVHAQAGADIVAPSGMLDGMVKAIRGGLDGAGLDHIPIMAYSAKYASAFYGPFRDAAQSPPQFGDRTSYQMDPANRLEALTEVAQDVSQGADMVMVKPALAYLDIIREVKNASPVPVAAYNVSGEYAMLKAAAQNGWIDEKRAILETLGSIHRAGADILITYHAMEAARWIGGK